MIAQLISDSQQDVPLLKSAALLRGLTDRDLPEAVAYVGAHPDRSSYHLLFAIRRASPAAYQRIDPAARARILADALAHVRFLNDWGYLDPSGSHDGEAAAALLELGRAAIEPLRPLLTNEQAAPLYGSEPATVSSTYRFRRMDFAYRYIVLLLGRVPEFEADPAARDARVAQLRAELDSK